MTTALVFSGISLLGIGTFCVLYALSVRRESKLKDTARELESQLFHAEAALADALEQYGRQVAANKKLTDEIKEFENDLEELADYMPDDHVRRWFDRLLSPKDSG